MHRRNIAALRAASERPCIDVSIDQRPNTGSAVRMAHGEGHFGAVVRTDPPAFPDTTNESKSLGVRVPTRGVTDDGDRAGGSIANVKPFVVGAKKSEVLLSTQFHRHSRSVP